ncbi:MAG: alpha/beta hydrolase [Actinomycetota bacterium]
MEALRIDVGDASLDVNAYGHDGPLVCLLPGLGGGIRRFTDLGNRLAAAGHRAMAINPRGAGTSTGPLDGLRMVDLADDVAGVIEHVGGPAVVVGNAFGNRVARFLAVHRPELVSAVVLVCAGGEVPPEPEAARALAEFLDESLTEEARLDAARRALFAPGRDVDPSFIDPGRSITAARAQRAAARAEPADGWLSGGSAPMLVVQGAEDRIAPPENGHRLARRWPDRVQVIDIAEAGHAVLNEQPHLVVEAVAAFIAEHA